MHIQQATYNFDSPEKAQEAISGIWERGGYVRPTPGKANSIDVVANTNEFAAIRSYAMPTAGAPNPAATAEGAEGTEDTAGNVANVAPGNLG